MSEYKEGEGPWKFLAHTRRHIVLDPKDHAKVLAESVDWVFTVEDPKAAQYLADNGFEEYSPITAEDEIQIEGIGLVQVGKLPAGLAKELIGKSRKLLTRPLGAVKDMLGDEPDSPLGDTDEAPQGDFMCEYCERFFESQAAVNGHKASCEKRLEALAEKGE